jgi:hypothetical protein
VLNIVHREKKIEKTTERQNKADRATERQNKTEKVLERQNNAERARERQNSVRDDDANIGYEHFSNFTSDDHYFDSVSVFGAPL